MLLLHYDTCRFALLPRTMTRYSRQKSAKYQNGNANTFMSNYMSPGLNGHHLPDDIFKWIFMNENALIAINISLKFVPMGPINSIPALVQIMPWRQPGDKTLSEPMLVSLLTHIFFTRPQ